MTRIKNGAAGAMLVALMLWAAMVLPAAAASGSTQLRDGGHVTVGLAEAPDVLDPSTARTYVGRMVLVNTCEKLYDINKHLQLVPELASAMPKVSADGKTYTIKLRQGIKFNDGTAFNAAAVKKTLERNIHSPRSTRAASLSSIQAIHVVNPTTLRLTLSHAFAPLTSILAGRAGMVESPAQLKKLGKNFGQHPVCVGPFSFVSRPSSDRIELKKSKYYYDKAKVHLDHVTFKVITQPHVRTQNLRAGAIDAADRIAPPDVPTIKNGAHTRLIAVPSLAYRGITINVSNSNGASHKPFTLRSTPLAQHPKLRQALALSLNRRVINRVVFRGLFTPDCTPISPASPYYPADFSCPHYDLAKAKKLVSESGVTPPIDVTLMLQAANSQISRLGQIIQSMAKQAGFHVTLQPVEFTTALNNERAGHFDAFIIGWSGRVDPDQNIAPFWLPSSLLDGSGAHYPAVIKLIKAERESTSKTQRKQLFAKLVHQFLVHNNIIYLYHPKFLLGIRKNLAGVRYFPDQLIRLKSAGFTQQE